jgi:LemA protein
MAYDPGGLSYGVPGLEPRRARVGPWVVAGLVLLLGLALLLVYNDLASRTEAVDAAWAQVESAHQRRADLVPALVAVLKRHMSYEAQTLVAIVETRNAAARVLQSAEPPAGDAALARVANAEGDLGLGLRGLVALAEHHPELRAADSFLELQAQLEGAENRIHVARVEFNEAVRAYNAAIQRLPGAWIARARALERRGYFESDERADRAPALALD